MVGAFFEGSKDEAQKDCVHPKHFVPLRSGLLYDADGSYAAISRRAVSDGESGSRRRRRPLDDDGGLHKLARAGDRSAGHRLQSLPLDGRRRAGRFSTRLRSPARPTSSTTRRDLAQANAYFVRPIVFGLEQAPSASFTLPANAPVRQYLRVPLQVPPGGRDAGRARLTPTAPTTPASAISTATANTRSSSNGIPRTRRTTRRAATRATSTSTLTSSTARGCGASTSAATSAPARTTRSSWSTTSTATGRPRSPARPRTEPSTARAR